MRYEDKPSVESSLLLFIEPAKGMMRSGGGGWHHRPTDSKQRLKNLQKAGKFPNKASNQHLMQFKAMNFEAARSHFNLNIS